MSSLQKGDKSSALSVFSATSTRSPDTSAAISQECADHLCQKRGCEECGGDLFKPLLEFDAGILSADIKAQLRELGWSPDEGNPADYYDEYGDSLLHSAARLGKTKVLKELLAIGAEVDICCQGGCCCSPLMVACRWCHLDCACLLIEHGANINKTNTFGETAFDQVSNRARGNEQDRALMLSWLSNTGIVP